MLNSGVDREGVARSLSSPSTRVRFHLHLRIGEARYNLRTQVVFRFPELQPNMEQKPPRRRFLQLAGSSIASTLLAGAAAVGWARSPSSPRTNAPRLSIASRTIKIGMSAAFTGTAAALGAELYRGTQAYYDEVNDAGGVHGRPISVVVLDDRYDPLPCVMNTLRLLEEEGVFLLSGYVGTPTLTRALPFIKQYAQEHDEDFALVGVFTGAQPQREPPYGEYVF